MDRRHATATLRQAHGLVLRLRDEGADDHTIAAAIDVDDRDVATIVEIAEAKLSRLMADSDTSAPET